MFSSHRVRFHLEAFSLSQSFLHLDEREPKSHFYHIMSPFVVLQSLEKCLNKRFFLLSK